MNKMKILYITPLRGGIGHWSRCLIEELDKLADITIVTFKRKRKEDVTKPFTRVTDDFILEVINPERPHHIIEYNNKKSLEDLVRLTDKIKPDCVYFVMWAGRQITWFLKDYSNMLNKKNISIVLTLHEAYPQILQEGDIKLFTDAYAYADHIVVLTDDALSDLRRAGITIPISIILHGNYHAMNKNKVDDREARAIISKHLSVKINDKTRVILFFGFIRDYKGLIYLIRAAPYVLEKTPTTLFIAAGSLELAENPSQYRKEIQRLDLERKFLLFPEFVKDYILMESLYKAADVVVYPYVGVSQSGVMFTALGMKRPVIISELGSFIRKLEKEGVILTSKPKDPISIAEKILYLLEREEERKELAERAYRILENEYNWEIIAREYHNIFKNLTMKS
ncbi:MAG: glycosyltransferase [Thermoplasmatales archaeon]|nr:MAG: glycosyltransferase [Thermoplasmatales archaeon]